MAENRVGGVDEVEALWRFVLGERGRGEGEGEGRMLDWMDGFDLI